MQNNLSGERRGVSQQSRRPAGLPAARRRASARPSSGQPQGPGACPLQSPEPALLLSAGDFGTALDFKTLTDKGLTSLESSKHRKKITFLLQDFVTKCKSKS